MNVKGSKDRKKKRWEDNIKKWTGMDCTAENRPRWKKAVAKSCVVPQRSCKVMG